MRLATLAATVAAAAALLGCGSKATVEGIVQDTAGNPITDAAATIEGSTAVGMTDASGHFSLRWVPGSYKVVVGKSGYLSADTEVEATEAQVYDLGTFALQPTPPDKGLWLFSGGEFTAIARVPIEKTAKGLARNYCILGSVGDPTPVPAGDLQFFDWSQMDRHLVRLDEDNCAGVSAGPPRYETLMDDDLDEQVEELTDQMKMRRVTLTPGRYVYADWTNGWFRAEASYLVVQ